MKESDLMRLIMLEVTRLGHRVFRNNSGLFYRKGDAKNNFPIRCGLCVGSSDLIGFTKQGKFLAIEVKTDKGIIEAAQEQFIRQVNAAGGVAFVARSVRDVSEYLK